MLGEREERRARLQTFAEMTRADTALVLFRDVELDILLPMPDTPTLASGPGWTELFESCRAPGLRSLSLPLGLDGSPRSTCILVAGNGTALVLIGSSRELEASLGAELAPALGLLGTCLREEQKSTASRAREKVADAYASTSNALTAALDRSRDELRTSLGETARLNRLLEEANHRKDRFLAILSHELRNPVWALTAALQAMRVGGQSGDNAVRLERQVDTATRHAGQIARLLDDLLDISRITQDKFELRRTQVDLRDLILHVGRIFGAHARPKGVNFVLSTPTRPVWVVGDAARLEQVLTNLLVNAVKYTDAGGSVFLETSEDDGNVSIIVRDSGIGIAPNVLPNVFDLFVQADEARERSRGGLGIGLTLVRQLVELHGGEVMALSAGAGHGTEMRVVLPTIPASEVVIAKRRPSPMSRARRGASSSSTTTVMPPTCSARSCSRGGT
jgi:two-component system, sensor histidine kinase